MFQQVFLAFHSKLRDRIQFLIAEYLQGNTNVTGPLVDQTDEVFQIVADLQTVLDELDKLDVEEDDEDLYKDYLEELKMRVGFFEKNFILFFFSSVLNPTLLQPSNL